MNNMIKFENELMENNEYFIGKYLKYLDVSELTIKEYSVGIRKFFEYCYEKGIKEIKREDIIEFREKLKENGKEPATINLYLTSVKSFFKWLEYEGMYKDITKNVKALPVSDTHKRDSLNIEQIKQVLDNCKNDKEKLIVSIAVSTGLRCNEICNIRLQDFKEQNGVILLYVLGKARQGTRVDCVVVSQELYEQIKNYVELYNVQEYLFTSTSNNNKGAILSTRAVRNMINNVFEKAGLKTEQIVFHSLRHSFANVSIQNGADIREVSQALRHKGVNTTMRYLHDLEVVNNKCSNLVSNIIF